MDGVEFIECIKEKIEKQYAYQESLEFATVPGQINPNLHGYAPFIGIAYDELVQLFSNPAGVRTLGEVYNHRNLRDANQERLARFIRRRLGRYGYWLETPEDIAITMPQHWWDSESLKLGVLEILVWATELTLTELRLLESSTGDQNGDSVKQVPSYQLKDPRKVKTRGRPKDPEVQRRVQILHKHEINTAADLRKDPKNLRNAFAEMDEKIEIPGFRRDKEWMSLLNNPARSRDLETVINNLRISLYRIKG